MLSKYFSWALHSVSRFIRQSTHHKQQTACQKADGLSLSFTPFSSTNGSLLFSFHDLLQLIHQDDRVIHRPHGTHDRVVTGHAADDLMESDHIERLSDRHRHTGNGLDHENILCHIHGDIAVTEDADVFFSEILLMLHDCVALASVFPRCFCEL